MRVSRGGGNTHQELVTIRATSRWTSWLCDTRELAVLLRATLVSDLHEIDHKSCGVLDRLRDDSPGLAVPHVMLLGVDGMNRHTASKQCFFGKALLWGSGISLGPTCLNW